ncbi:MAG: VWA domain-containing protein, partial [bacterium]
MFGMSLLNSVFLWGVTAAAIPVVIHLIKRNRAVKLPFAAMRFLQIDPARKFKSQRLKQLLILLMRLTAFALLAVAFARPFFKNLQAGAVWGSDQRAAVILVDNSLSMGYEDNFRKATDKAKELLGSFKVGDEVALVQFSDDATVIAETKDGFASLKNQLQDKLFLSSKGTNYMQALQTAETILLHSPMKSKSIYLISDFQKTAWENLNPHWNIQSGIALNFLPVESSSFSNVTIMDVRISRDHLTAKRGDVLARVKNFGPDRKQFKVTLNINNKKISQRSQTLLANEETIVRFRSVKFPDRNVFGSVDIDYKENLTVDNRHFFVLEKDAKTRILAVNGEYNKDATQDELFYLDRAINLPSIARYSLVKTTPNKAKRFDFNDYGVIILANLKNLDRATIQRLIYYVRAGGGLVIGLGENVKPAVFNRLFRDLTPASIENLAFKSLNRDNGVILAEIDYQHSIFRLFADPGQSDPSAAQFYQYFEVDPANPESVLAYFDDGSPAILEKKVGGGKVILFTSTLDADWNNLPIKAMFLPLL